MASFDDFGAASDLRKVKDDARREFGGVGGVEGFGIGDGRLRIYVRHADVRQQLPDVFEGVAVDCEVVGEITAL